MSEEPSMLGRHEEMEEMGAIYDQTFHPHFG
jgi:hypothetical protein